MEKKYLRIMLMVYLFVMFAAAFGVQYLGHDPADVSTALMATLLPAGMLAITLHLVFVLRRTGYSKPTLALGAAFFMAGLTVMPNPNTGFIVAVGMVLTLFLTARLRLTENGPNRYDFATAFLLVALMPSSLLLDNRGGGAAAVLLWLIPQIACAYLAYMSCRENVRFSSQSNSELQLHRSQQLS